MYWRISCFGRWWRWCWRTRWQTANKVIAKQAPPASPPHHHHHHHRQNTRGHFMLAGSLAHCPELAAITDEKWCYMEWERARTAQQRTGSMTILQPPPLPLSPPASTASTASTASHNPSLQSRKKKIIIKKIENILSLACHALRD